MKAILKNPVTWLVMVLGCFLFLLATLVAGLAWNINTESQANLIANRARATMYALEANSTITPTSTAVPPTATLIPTVIPTFTRLPATTATTTKLPTIKPEDKFLSESEVPDCYPVNGPWLEAFGKGKEYEISRDSKIFKADDFVYFEGVLVGSNPKDLHQTFEMTSTVKAEQGNVWTCGPRKEMAAEARHTILFQSADKKWQNWDGQAEKPFHPMKVVTEFGNWSYKAGEKPAWALNSPVANCPFAKPELNNPAGAILQADGTFIGAPGKAGCDFLAQYPDNTAKRYKGARDSFPYPAGTKFWIFDPKLSNAELAKQLNLAEKAITEGK